MSAFDELEAEIGARLHRLWARLEAGEYEDSPIQFYTRCLDELDTIRVEAQEITRHSLADVQGIMYEQIRRGLHRFDRVSL